MAAESGQEPMEGAVVGAVGCTLALAAIELLERYDDRYAHEQYPRAAIRRNSLRRQIAMIEGDGELLSSHVEDWEKAADPLAADALKVALRRRAVAHDAVTRLLTGEDGSATWTQEEFTDALRAVLRHSRSATLLALADVYEHPDRFDAGVRRRVRTFVDEFLDEWQGEPLYAPFLDEIHPRGG